MNLLRVKPSMIDIKVKVSSIHQSMRRIHSSHFCRACISLSEAIKNRDYGSVNRLVTSHNINYSFQNDSFENKNASTAPIHDAAYVGDIHMITWLVDLGADPTLKDSLGRSPLHIAAMSGNENAAMYFATLNDVNLFSIQGETALYLATLHGHVGVMQMLLWRNARIYMKYSPMGERRGVRKMEVLHAAVKFASSEHGNMTPLRIILDNISFDHLNVIDNDGFAAIHLAVIGKHDDVFTLLLAHHTNASTTIMSEEDDKNEYTALHLLANGYGTLDMMNEILKIQGLDLDLKNSKGNTALHLAAKQPFAICRLDALLLAGANPFVTNCFNQTPSEFAKAKLDGVETDETITLDRITDNVKKTMSKIDHDEDHPRYFSISEKGVMATIFARYAMQRMHLYRQFKQRSHEE
jgi:ankyrin repeat protein